MDPSNVYRASPPSFAPLESACLLCGAEHDADGACPSCGVAMPRVVCVCGVLNGVTAACCRTCGNALAPPPLQSNACPRCAASLLEVGLDATASVHVCTACRGLFVGPRAWFLLLGRDDLVASIARHFPPVASSTAIAPELLRCPECGAQMDRGRFSATSTVTVDACTAQHGVWLDGGELGAVVSYAKHRRQLSDREAIAEAERVERQLTGYDAALVRRDLEELEVVNRATARAVAVVSAGRPRLDGWWPLVIFLAVLGLAVLLFWQRI
jgi:Zn-finger nucleic acid-binding protein